MLPQLLGLQMATCFAAAELDSTSFPFTPCLLCILAHLSKESETKKKKSAGGHALMHTFYYVGV